MFDAVYSDPHYGHEAIIGYEDRPFTSIGEMNEVMIQLYNEVVKPNHVCLWLGDAFLMPYTWAKLIMDRLNGTKFIIPGNHDRSPRGLANIGFAVITKELVFKIGDKTVRASHYPYLNTDSRHVKTLSEKKRAKALNRHPQRIKGEILIHGHSHGHRRRLQNMVNMGVDAWDYRPATWEEVKKEVEQI